MYQKPRNIHRAVMTASHRIRRVALAVPLICALALGSAGCGAEDTTATTKAGGSSAGKRISLVGFSTPREAYEELIPAFQDTPGGAGVEFDQSYGSSGEQSRAVEGGLPADVVHLALEPDVTRLVDAQLVAPDWSKGAHHGFVTTSTVVLVVRPGNPKKITTWDDLLDDDVEIVTPNPFTSGGARWNLMAAYGAWRRAGASHEQARGKLEQLLRNTPVQSKSAREALQVFASGKGDVMLAYEQEAIQAEAKGEDFEHVVPDSTILIENPIAVVDAAKGDGAQGHAAAVSAWMDFLYSDAAQQVFASHGYRPVVESAAATGGVEFPTPDDLFTIDDLGGWTKVTAEFFDREHGIVAEIEQGLGVATDG